MSVISVLDNCPICKTDKSDFIYQSSTVGTCDIVSYSCPIYYSNQPITHYSFSYHEYSIFKKNKCDFIEDINYGKYSITNYTNESVLQKDLVVVFECERRLVFSSIEEIENFLILK